MPQRLADGLQKPHPFFLGDVKGLAELARIKEVLADNAVVVSSGGLDPVLVLFLGSS